MKDGHPVAVIRRKQPYRLGGQGNFGNQHDHALSGRQTVVNDRLHHSGLSASGYAVEKCGLRLPRVAESPDAASGLFLLCGQIVLIRHLPLDRGGPAVNFLFSAGKLSSFHHAFQGHGALSEACGQFA